MADTTNPEFVFNPPKLPMVHFGVVDENEEPEGWKEFVDFDPDDEEMDVTPPDVIEMLGFDPKEFSQEDGAINK